MSKDYYESERHGLKTSADIVLGVRVGGVLRPVHACGEMESEIISILEKYDPSVVLQSEIKVESEPV